VLTLMAALQNMLGGFMQVCPIREREMKCQPCSLNNRATLASAGFTGSVSITKLHLVKTGFEGGNESPHFSRT
jgi:hypothetical protein